MTPEELKAAMPADMHPYAYMFLHPWTAGDGSPPASLDMESMNSFARFVELMGFRPVEECMLRYDPPRVGPIHPNNPGSWTDKTKPAPERVDPLAHVRAMLADLPAATRADLLEEAGS